MSAIAFPRAVPSQALNVIWARFSFAVLMVVTFVLYMSGVDRNGWANAYYAAAVEAGATNWKAFFFGSLDASNFITVDKSPAFLWVMEISARLFGFNEWSVLVPQALEGVATVALVFVAVRRWFGSAAGLIAGAVVALTPVAALMFRYNNPDALLVLLLTGGAYATLRAVESGSTRWLVLAAALIGTGFLAKMLQAFVVVPVVVLIYLALGRPRLLRRIKQLVIAVFRSGQVFAAPYYPIALPPAIGALVGAGSVDLWNRRSSWIARLFLASALAATSLWAFLLLGGTPDWNPSLKVAILAIGLGAAAMIAAGPLPARSPPVGVAAAALVAALAGPAAYTFDTVTTAHAGAIPSAGPSAQTASLGPGHAPAGLRGTPGGFGPPPNAGGLPGQARAGAGGGTFLNASRPGAQLTSLLEAGAGRYRWVAATIDANSAAGYELATGKPVMAIGGFNGSDPAPTLAQFESYVSQGQIHYFIAGGIRGGSGSSSEIEAWVSQHFTATTVDGVTVYDLTQPAS